MTLSMMEKDMRYSYVRNAFLYTRDIKKEPRDVFIFDEYFDFLSLKGFGLK
jgi:hypothetical protein